MQHTSHTNTDRRSGFTVIELLLVLPLAAVIVTVFVSILIITLQFATRNKTQLEQVGTSQLALNQLERDVRYSTEYLMSLPDEFSDPNANGFSETWSYRGSPYSDSNKRVLLLRSFTTEGNPYAPNRTPIYTDSAEYNCSVTPPSGTLYLNPQLSYITIYFIKSKTLYRRIVTDTTTPICGSADIYQKQSCPTGSGGICEAKDEIMARNVSAFRIGYYVQEDEPEPTFTELSAYSGSPPDPINSATNILVELNLEQEVAGKPIKTNLELNVSRLNT